MLTNVISQLSPTVLTNTRSFLLLVFSTFKLKTNELKTDATRLSVHVTFGMVIWVIVIVFVILHVVH